MARLHVYLYFNGNCEEALGFYCNALKGEVEFLQRYKDAPMPYAEGQGEKIMHASLKAGDIYIMASDGMPEQEVVTGSNIQLSLTCDSIEEQDQLFRALSDGGEVIMPLEEAFWGDRFGMITDRYGINWMFNYNTGKGKMSSAG